MAIYTSSSLSTGKIQLHCEDPNNMSRLHFPPLPFPSCSNSHVTQKPNIVFIQSKKLLILKEYFIFTKKKKKSKQYKNLQNMETTFSDSQDIYNSYYTCSSSLAEEWTIMGRVSVRSSAVPCKSCGRKELKVTIETR
jgi:hypothetical protein